MVVPSGRDEGWRRTRFRLPSLPEMVYFSYHNDAESFDLPDFEFDEAKSRMNAEKHGIDFEQAQALWLDSRRSETPARNEDEDRWLVVGTIDGQFWTAVVTYRDEAVRIISVRRSCPREIAIYESQ